MANSTLGPKRDAYKGAQKQSRETSRFEPELEDFDFFVFISKVVLSFKQGLENPTRCPTRDFCWEFSGDLGVSVNFCGRSVEISGMD